MQVGCQDRRENRPSRPASLIAAAQSMHDLRARASQTSIVDARAETGHTVTTDDRSIGLVPSKLPPGFVFRVTKPRKPN